MKQLVFSLFILVSISSMSQIKLGLQLAPVISSNRVKNDAQTLKKDGSKLNISIGLIVDKALSDTYYFSSGLIYLPKRVAFRSADGMIKEAYTLQYLQIPISVKLFTNEFAPDFKIYLQVGSALEFKIFDEVEDPSFVTVKKFALVDVPVIIGAGIEYRAGINTILYGGFSYQRGLINVVSEASKMYEDIRVYNTIFAIDMGVKF